MEPSPRASEILARILEGSRATDVQIEKIHVLQDRLDSIEKRIKELKAGR
jgi:hypothetical protein